MAVLVVEVEDVVEDEDWEVDVKEADEVVSSAEVNELVSMDGCVNSVEKLHVEIEDGVEEDGEIIEEENEELDAVESLDVAMEVVIVVDDVLVVLVI